MASRCRSQGSQAPDLLWTRCQLWVPRPHDLQTRCGDEACPQSERHSRALESDMGRMCSEGPPKPGGLPAGATPAALPYPRRRRLSSPSRALPCAARQRPGCGGAGGGGGGRGRRGGAKRAFEFPIRLGVILASLTMALPVAAWMLSTTFSTIRS
jgi:hypothetical protein